MIYRIQDVALLPLPLQLLSAALAALRANPAIKGLIVVHRCGRRVGETKERNQQLAQLHD